MEHPTGMVEVELESSTVVLLEPRHRGASVLSSTANLANTILGAGMLGLPHAFAMAGFVPGSFMLVAFAGSASLGLHLLSEAASKAGRPASFYQVAEKALPGAGLIIDVAVAVKCFGVATGYLIVVGDSMPKALQAMGATGLWLERRAWTLATAILIAPLVFLRRVDGLKFTSIIAIICIQFVVLLILLFALQPAPIFDPCDASPPTLPPLLPPTAPRSLPQPPSVPLSPPLPAPCRLPTVSSASPMSILRATPIFVFSYTCHQNIISISNEMVRPTPSRVLLVIVTAVSLAVVLYFVVSLAGYQTFGPAVDGDILSTYPSTPLVGVARIGISIVVAFSYPLQSHPSRGCIISLLSALAKRCGLDERGRVVDAAERARSHVQPAGASGDDHGGGTSSQWALRNGRVLHLVVTTLFLLTSTSIALAVHNLGVVLSLVGATGSTTVTYILPGLTYFLLHRTGRARWLGLAQLGAGLILMPISLTLILLPHDK